MEPSVFGLSPFLIGRSSEMDTLSAMFENNTNSIVTITGISGIGKSELAKKFCTKIINAKKCIQVFRLNGHSPQSLHQNIIRLAQCIGGIQLPQKANRSRDIVEIFQDVIGRFITSPMKILLLIDNVNDLSACESVKSLFTETVRDNLFTMVNTNAKNLMIFDSTAEVLHLDLLQPSDAEKIIVNSLQHPVAEPKGDIQILAELLHNFPLALSLVTAYIRMQKKEDTNYKVRDYIHEFENYEVEPSVTMPEHAFIKTIFTAWNISIRKIKQLGETGTIAVELINIMAYCEPEEIPTNFLWKVNGQIQPIERIYDAIILAYNYGLIDGDGTAERINRLFQKIIRSEVQTSETEIEFLRKIVRSINDNVYDALKVLDMPHVQCIWSLAANYPDIVKEFDKFSDRIGDKLCNLALYMNYLDFSIKYETKLAEILGPNHAETLTMESQVAYALWHNGKFTESLAKHMKAHAKLKHILGEYNEVTLITLNNTALVLDSLGKSDEAMEVCESVWLSKKIFFGEEHPKTFTSMELYIGSLWRNGLNDANNFSKAIQLFEELVNVQTRVLGEDHLTVMQTKLRWADRFCGFDRPDKTVQLMKEVLASKERIYGPQHSETNQIRNQIKQFLIFFSNHRLLRDEVQPV